MEDKKKWYVSKGVWTGIVTVILGLYASVDSSIAPLFGFDLPAIPEFIYVVLGALGLYSRVVAKTEIK